MKKTLIALAVAASAAVSGSAMAWTANGDGGSVDLGGTLTPSYAVTPWVVKVGAAVNGLDALIKKGQKTAVIAVNRAIPVLGIRTSTAEAFRGKAGITPQIDYKGAVDIDGFRSGGTTLTLEVKDANDAKIGSMSVSFSAAAARSYSFDNIEGESSRNLFATQEGQSFFGGLGKNESAIASDAKALITLIDADIVANYNSWQLTNITGSLADDFSANVFHSGFYGSGIESGKSIKITLDQNVSGDAPIVWKASLPVTVSYQ
ncbi:fimbrial protein [Salmonella enterica]|nr:fimbrial protein [Salmonella enterica]EBP0843393.1 fimbrial protein [Salmonella enterica]